MTSEKREETLPDDLSQPGPSKKTDSQDEHKRDEEGKQENRDQKEANDSNDNKTEKTASKREMTYKVLEVKDPVMIALIECLKISKSLFVVVAEISPNAADYLNLDENTKILVVEAEDSSSNESENRSTHDTDQDRNENLMPEREKDDKDQVEKTGEQK